jgi:hypothetical protein
VGPGVVSGEEEEEDEELDEEDEEKPEGGKNGELEEEELEDGDNGVMPSHLLQMLLAVSLLFLAKTLMNANDILWSKNLRDSDETVLSVALSHAKTSSAPLNLGFRVLNTYSHSAWLSSNPPCQRQTRRAMILDLLAIASSG